MHRTKIKEKVGKSAFLAAAAICVCAVVAIFVFMFAKSFPAFKKIGVFQFVFGEKWAPDRLDTYDSVLSGSYGVFKMIVGTLAATAGAVLIGGTLGFFTATFIAFYCPKKLKRPFSAIINLLAGIPSVVYGFFGISFLLPLLSNFAPNNGGGLLATSLVLGIMITPTVVSLSKTSLEAAPSAYYEGSLALGADRSGSVFGVVVPSARSGILAALILGIGRALGETMAVVMVAGNSVAFPNSLFNSFRVLTANIVMEMGYAGEVQSGALVATGVVLLAFVFAINSLFGFASKRAVKGTVEKKGGRFKEKGRGRAKKSVLSTKVSDFFSAVKSKANLPRAGGVCSIVAGCVVGLVLALIIGFILSKGAPYLIKNPSILVGKYRFGDEKITLLPSIITTFMAVGLSLIISLPIGIGVAIYLNEYAKKNGVLAKIIRGAIDLLNGVPSIVYGLFGAISFVGLLGGSCSILAGSLTVGVMLLPSIERSCEESLRSVQDSLREGSLALGAGKLRTIIRVVLPSALPGIASAAVLSMGRVVSESAPFMYTMGSVLSAPPKSPMDGGATLAVALYRLSGEGWHMDEAYATAVVLIVLALGLNLLAEAITARFEKKLKGR